MSTGSGSVSAMCGGVLVLVAVVGILAEEGGERVGVVGGHGMVMTCVCEEKIPLGAEGRSTSSGVNLNGNSMYSTHVPDGTIPADSRKR